MTRKPSNPVTLAGDVHNNWVNDIRLNVDDPRTPIVATEFVGTSITSTGDGADMSPLMKAMVSENECVRFANNQRGYVRFDLKPKELRADFRVVEYVSKPGAPIKTRASFVVEDGGPGAKEAVDTIRVPFFVQRIVRGGLAGASIPIAGIPEIAFLSMKVGVNPRARLVLDLLRNRMGGAPIAFRVFPHRPKSRRKFSGAASSARAWSGIVRESSFP